MPNLANWINSTEKIIGPVKFFSGTLDGYRSITTKSPNGIYFVLDEQTGNKMLFLENELFPVHFQIINSDEELPTQGVADFLYINNKTNNFSYWIDPILNEDGSVATAGHYEVKYGENIVHRDTFIDALKRATYDSAKRLITIPQWDDTNGVQTLSIDLGKDLIIDGEHTTYDTANRQIVLAFKTMDSTDTNDITYIYIPVLDLVDIYKGSNTKSILITVDSITDTNSVDERTIKADINLYSPITTEKPNALVIKDAGGLYVDVETYTDSEIGDLGNNKSNVAFKTVAEAIAQAQNDADTAQATADLKVNKTTTVNGKALSDNIILSVGDIPGAAPTESPVFTGTITVNKSSNDLGELLINVPTVFSTSVKRTNFDYSTNIMTNGVYNDSAQELATLQYVVDSINLSNTWDGVIKYKTWNSLIQL